jgi:hypothetical protein
MIAGLPKMSYRSPSSPQHRRRLVWLAPLLILAIIGVPRRAAAAPTRDTAPAQNLASFVASVVNGDRNALRGVYSEGVMALAVVQQPDPTFVSIAPDTATQFGMAEPYGVVGLLAHNSLAGQDFFRLGIGSLVLLVYGDGHIDSFWVAHVYRYRATTPESVYSSFVDLSTDDLVDATGLFNKVYTGQEHVTFQTCIAAQGQPSWGRLFVVAEPSPSLPTTWFARHPIAAAQ